MDRTLARRGTIPLLVVTALLLAGCAAPLPPGHTRVSPDKQTELSLDGGGTLSIPEGAFDQETVLRVERQTPAAMPDATDAALVSEVYALEQQEPADLTKPLTLRIPYRPDLLPEGASPHAISVVWWDGKAWRDVPSTVDAQTNTVSATIDHFSSFSAAWRWFDDLAYDAEGNIRGIFFDAKHTNGAFTVHYTTKPFSEYLTRWGITADHRPSATDANRNGVPDYIENLGVYLSRSKAKFEAGGPHFPGMSVPVSSVGGTIHVFVADLGYTPTTGDGTLGDASPLTSHIRIDNNLDDAQLRNTAAHELFHYWQFSRLWLKTGDKHRWWMEATAAWAMDEAFPDLNLYAQEIRNHLSSPPKSGFVDLPSRKVSEYYAAASLAKYLENRSPGFVMATFDPDAGLSYVDSWATTFGALLKERTGASFTDVFTDYLASYFFHWDFDPDVPLWFNNNRWSLADPDVLVRSGSYTRIRAALPPLSGRSAVFKTPGDSRPAKLVARLHATEHTPEVMVFAASGILEKFQRVALPGGGGRTGLALREEPEMMAVVEGFGGASAGSPVNSVYLVAANPRKGTVAEDTMDLEVYVLEPPRNLRTESVGEGRLKLLWDASELPLGEKPKDEGALKGYNLYRRNPGAGYVLIRRTDAPAMSFEMAVKELAGGLDEAILVMRAEDKYGTESNDSDEVRVAAPARPSTSGGLPGRIYLGSTSYEQLDEMNKGLYLITPADGKKRLISPRAIDGVAISPDGTKLAAGMLEETGAGPGDPQLAIFDAADQSFKLLRGVFKLWPSDSGPQQLTGPAWAKDSTTLVVSRVGDLHLYDYAGDKGSRKILGGWQAALSPVDNRLVVAGGDGLSVLDDALKGAYTYDPWTEEIYVFETPREGALTTISGVPGDATKPEWSPDGKNILFVSKGTVWVIPVAGGSPKVLTPDGWKATAPAYSPDGSHIAFVRLEAEPDGGIWVVKADGSEPRQIVRTAMDHIWRTDMDWGS